MTASSPPTAHRKGLTAELAAAAFLMLKGYRILALRFKTPVGEIDLIATRGRTIVFVEVKRRATLDAGVAAVLPPARARITRAAELYLQKHPRYTGRTARFDVVAVAPFAWPRHLRAAW